jgi:diguanylate cyclase (GGDEF)-like protein/PAS domain S-box-containing protein
VRIAPRHVERQKLRLSRFLMAAASAAMFCLLGLALYLQGLMEARAVLQTAALAAASSLVFYVVFRSGLNKRCADPSLTGPMMSVSVGILLYTMSISATAYETFGIFIGVIMLFGVFRFSGRELLLYALGSLIAYGAMIRLTASEARPPGSAADMDMARWLVLAIALLMLAWVGGHINRFRRRMDERKAFYQAIWDACSDVVVVVDDQGLIQYVNPAAQHVFGVGPSKLTGASLARLQPPEPRSDAASTLIDEALANRRLGLSVTGESLGWHAEGRPLPLEVTFSTVLLEGQRMVVGFLRDITERKESEQRIRYMAGHDALTGLPNRVLLKDRLTQAIADARRRNLSVWVAFLDIDRFKLINDSLGHAAGDVLLTTVAGRLRSALREGDTVARLGGDEFVLVLTEHAPGSLTPPVVERVMRSVEQPLSTHGHELLPTCSMGISVFPSDGDDAGTLIEHADITMYRAKQQGRNRFCFYAASMNRHARERLVLERELRVALEQGQFVLHYQPQVELATGRIVGVEALVRWAHPRSGLVGPEDFIGVAEEMGLIVPLGQWVLRTACRQNRAWQRAGMAPMRVAVNLSARQFAEPGLLPSVREALDEAELEARYLEVEITESLVMSDVGRTIETLEALKSLGVHLSIDDFGTGYSSLAYLKRFPIDTLKIDRSFVRDINADPEDAAIVEAIILLARSLGRSVVAEGVEDESQLRFLMRHRCDLVQGYLFSRALAPEALAACLENGSGAFRSRIENSFRAAASV